MIVVRYRWENTGKSNKLFSIFVFYFWSNSDYFTPRRDILKRFGYFGLLELVFRVNFGFLESTSNITNPMDSLPESNGFSWENVSLTWSFFVPDLFKITRWSFHKRQLCWNPPTSLSKSTTKNTKIWNFNFLDFFKHFPNRIYWILV